MDRIQRSRQDLKQMLLEQVELLQLSCETFDNGSETVAKHIAVALRVLLHEAGRSRSLLDQLGLRTGRFIDCSFEAAPPQHAGKLVLPPQCRLVATFMGADGGKFLPLSNRPNEQIRKTPFVDWWNEPVANDNKGRTFNRRELIRNVADTDGGAHVDPGLEEKYLDFSRRNSLMAHFSENGQDWKTIPAPHLSSMRTIAHELLLTLEGSAPRAFPRPYVYHNPMEGKDGFMIGGIAIEVNP